MQIHDKKAWDELKVVTTLDAYRKQQSRNKGPSFRTVAGTVPAHVNRIVSMFFLLIWNID